MSSERRGPRLSGAARYEKIRDLNSGSFGFVQLAKDKLTGKKVAIKFIDRGDKVNKHVKNEILNHRNLLHHHVIQFREVYLTKSHLCIVMEFAPGGDMLDYVKKKGGLTEDQARWFFQQLIIGLDYCHKMGVANRDIKLENTLLDDSPWPLLKICDFGYSKHEQLNSAPGSRVGTPAYLAPEVILNTRGSTYDGKTADMWSCGVFLYVMMIGAYPFEKPEDRRARDKLQRMIQRIVNVDYSIPSAAKMSEDCKDLLRKILVRNPKERITMEGVQAHKWFKKNLPKGAQEMNNHLKQQKNGLQSVEEITQILEKAKFKEVLKDEDATIDEELAQLTDEDF